MIIEFKQKEADLIRKVHDLVTLHERKEQVIWFSLRDDINVALRHYDPTIPNIASIGGMLKVIFVTNGRRRPRLIYRARIVC